MNIMKLKHKDILLNNFLLDIIKKENIIYEIKDKGKILEGTLFNFTLINEINKDLSVKDYKDLLYYALVDKLSKKILEVLGVTYE